jgi:polyisoprenoid-binding protein YceI
MCIDETEMVPAAAAGLALTGARSMRRPGTAFLAFGALAVLFGAGHPAAVQAPAAEWTIDSAHSRAQFAVRHLMVSTVRGLLGKVTGTIRFDGSDVKTLAVDVTIDVTGIDTAEPARDKHLRSADFFDTEKYPTLTFRSKRAEAAGAGRFRLVGDLTMHGVTKETTLSVEGPSPELKQGGTSRVGAMAMVRLSRKDFGLTWNRAIEAGGVTVSDEVDVTIDIEATRKTGATAN